MKQFTVKSSGHTINLKHVNTAKSYNFFTKRNCLTLKSYFKINKQQVKKSFLTDYGVNVKVNLSNYKPVSKYFRGKKGNTQGYKKVLVYFPDSFSVQEKFKSFFNLGK